MSDDFQRIKAVLTAVEGATERIFSPGPLAQSDHEGFLAELLIGLFDESVALGAMMRDLTQRPPPPPRIGPADPAEPITLFERSFLSYCDAAVRLGDMLRELLDDAYEDLGWSIDPEHFALVAGLDDDLPRSAPVPAPDLAEKVVYGPDPFGRTADAAARETSAAKEARIAAIRSALRASAELRAAAEDWLTKLRRSLSSGLLWILGTDHEHFDLLFQTKLRNGLHRIELGAQRETMRAEALRAEAQRAAAAPAAEIPERRPTRDWPDEWKTAADILALLRIPRSKEAAAKKRLDRLRKSDFRAFKEIANVQRNAARFLYHLPAAARELRDLSLECRSEKINEPEG